MGSKNNKAGSNKANPAADQMKAAEDRVRDEYGRVRTSKLQSEIAKGPTVKSSSGNINTSSGPLRQGFKNTALGRMGFDPSMIGRSDLPTTNTQGLITAPELRSIGVERDKLAAKPGRPRTTEELEQLSQFNRVLGLNPTSGMGIMGSLRQNLGGLEAQRDFARLGNFSKGIMNLMPGRAFVTGLLNKIPGVNLPTELSMSPINYNITDRMSDFYGAEGFNPMLSLEDQEMYSDPFLNRVLFGDPVVKSPVVNSPGEDMINVMPMKNPFGNPFSPAIVSDEQKKAFNAEFANNALGAYYNQFADEQLIGAGIDPNNPILQTTTNRLTPGQIMGLEAQGMGAHVGGIGPYNTDSPFVQSALQGTNTSSGYDLTSGSPAQKTFDSLYNMQNYGITGGL